MVLHVDYQNCTGCTACESSCNHNAISMQPDSLGFLYPKISPDLCVKCGICKRVCPIESCQKEENDNQVFVSLHNPDTTIQSQSSSGGLFSLVADYILNQKGVVYGVVYDENNIVKHVRTCTEDGVAKMRTSKYVQSDLNGIFKSVKADLMSNIDVLFVGTPCQVYGLYSYLNKKYYNLLTIDLICHGVSSPLLFSSYIHFIESKRGKKVVKINMKDKTNGWLNPTSKISYDDGSVEVNTIESDICLSLYYSKLAYRESCIHCHFSNLNRIGDLTIGDYWTNNRSYDKSVDVQNGESLCIINTIKGNDIFTKLTKSIPFTIRERNSCKQQALEYPAKPNALRSQFINDFLILSFKQIASKYFNYTITNRLKKIIKTIL